MNRLKAALSAIGAIAAIVIVNSDFALIVGIPVIAAIGFWTWLHEKPQGGNIP